MTDIIKNADIDANAVNETAGANVSNQVEEQEERYKMDINFRCRLLEDLLLQALAQNKFEFIDGEDEAFLHNLDETATSDAEIIEKFNAHFKTNYRVVKEWQQIDGEPQFDVEEFEPVIPGVAVALAGGEIDSSTDLDGDGVEDDDIDTDYIEDSEKGITVEDIVTPEVEVKQIECPSLTDEQKVKAKEMIDIICSDDDGTPSMEKVNESIKCLQLLPDDSLRVTIPTVVFENEQAKEGTDYSVVAKDTVTKLVQENASICSVLQEMGTMLHLNLSGKSMRERMQDVVTLFFSLKHNLAGVEEKIEQNKQLLATIDSLKAEVKALSDEKTELTNKVVELSKSDKTLSTINSLEKKRYVLSFLRPKTNDVVYLCKTEKGEFSPTKFSASFVLFDAFKFSSEEQVRDFLVLLIDNVGKHSIPEKYLENIKAQEIMLREVA